MNAKNILKVNVNGNKFLISGLKESTSCKDLLCALAKATQAQVCKRNDRLNEKNERSMKGLYSIDNDENLIETFKKDLKTVGDIESLKVFNNLSNNARITKRSCLKERKKSQGKHKDREKHRKESKKSKTKLPQPKHDPDLFKRKRYRSVDDSDVDSYKNVQLTRLTKRRSRVVDDNDIDVYRSLFDIVIHQTKQINNIEKQKKQDRKSDWMKELYRNSQIYYLDEETQEELTCFEKDNDNDSGLPTPEYDSSESQENQPIRTPDFLLKPITHENQIPRDRLFVDHKQTKHLSLEQHKTTSNDVTDLSFISVHNNMQNNCNIKPNKNKLLPNNSDEVLLNKNLNSFSDVADVKQDLDNKSQDTQSVELKKPLNKLFIENEEKKNLIKKKLHINGKTFSEDFNKNIIVANTLDVQPLAEEQQKFNEESKLKMVAFDAVLSKNNENKKLEKKKISKTDISDPVLLSPSTFKKHKVLVSVKKSLFLSDGILTSVQFDEGKKSSTKEDGEKVKKFNKKIKEIKKLRKSKSSRSKINDDKRELETNCETDRKNSKTYEEGKKEVETLKQINNDIRDTSESYESSIYNKNKDLSISCQSSNLTQDISNESCHDDDTCKQYNIRESEEREELLRMYEERKQALDDIIIQVIEYNLYIAEMSEQIHSTSFQESGDEMAEDEVNIYTELESVQTLLKTVTQVTTQQRAEMSVNLTLLDKLDIEVKTKKAGILNLKSGGTNTTAAPRSLLKYTKDKRKPGEKSFV